MPPVPSPTPPPLLCRAAGTTRRVPNVTSANLATMAMPPGAPRATASPVPATDPTVTASRCQPLVPHIPGDTGGVSPVPLSPRQGDQELLRGHRRAAHLQRLRPGTRRAPLREVLGSPSGGVGCGVWGATPPSLAFFGNLPPAIGACPGMWETRCGESRAEVSITGRGQDGGPCNGTEGGCA